MNKLSKINQNYYERIWGNHKIVDHRIWSTWTLIEELNPAKALEIGCGNKPRIDMKGNWFLDINSKVIEKIKELGGNCKPFDITNKFPFKDDEFNLVCAFEVLEHIDDDGKVLREISRVTAQNGTVMISIPLNRKYLTIYDKKVGHVRRYEPRELEGFFLGAGLVIKKYRPIKISWPSKWQAHLVSWFTVFFPHITTSIQNWLDFSPNSPLRKELPLLEWNKIAISGLANETTALFLLGKK